MISHLRSKLAGTRWLWLLFIAAILTNFGYGANLVLALQCEQYYLEYLLFFTLVFGAKAFLDASILQSSVSTTAIKSLKQGVLIASGFFLILWAYNTVTNCPFDPILFATTRLPLILAFSVGYQLWRFQKDTVAETDHSRGHVSIRRIDGATVQIELNDIVLARIENGVVRLTDKSGSMSSLEGSLSALYTELPDDEFYKANRNTIISRRYIHSYQTNTMRHMEVMMKSGQTVMINKNQCKAFRAWFTLNP